MLGSGMTHRININRPDLEEPAMTKQPTATVLNAAKVKTSIAMNPQLWKRLRIRSIEEQRSAFSILEQLVSDYLTRPLKKGGR